MMIAKCWEPLLMVLFRILGRSREYHRIMMLVSFPLATELRLLLLILIMFSNYHLQYMTAVKAYLADL